MELTVCLKNTMVGYYCFHKIVNPLQISVPGIHLMQSQYKIQIKNI